MSKINRILLVGTLLVVGSSQAFPWESCWDTTKYCFNRLGTGLAKTIQDPREWIAPAIALGTALSISQSHYRSNILEDCIFFAGLCSLGGSIASVIKHAIPKKHYPENTFVRLGLEHMPSILGLCVATLVFKTNTGYYYDPKADVFAIGIGTVLVGYLAYQWSNKWLEEKKPKKAGYTELNISDEDEQAEQEESDSEIEAPY